MQKKNHISIHEWDNLTANDIGQRAFDLLKKKAFLVEYQEVIKFNIAKSQETIQLKNHVGLIALENGFQIEILPKVSADSTQARAALINMLRTVPEAHFLTLPPASLSETASPLFEIFVVTFLNEIEKICRQGLQKNYVSVVSEQRFLKGKWLINKAQSQRPVAKSRFLVAHEEFCLDILPNRLLKTCLVFLKAKTVLSLKTQVQLQHLLELFGLVNVSHNITTDFQQVATLDRRFERYRSALQWAKTLLNFGGWYGSGEIEKLPSLLFRTETLFESFVAKQIKRQMPDSEVICQAQVHHLLQTNEGQNKFGLRPDIVIKKNGKTLVLDTKWKYVSPEKSSKNYGIEQADLYQMYAYGQKYKANSLYLIYPAHDGFKEILPPFWFEKDLPLYVVPFDILSQKVDFQWLETSCHSPQ